ncbi:uncharacterized protein LAESUDRAFT_139767 [Laetiporus sulphureus 93-53]|uniref:INO80 complex subunit B-like conserved region domain-containing protein n=1 Tax=Laetiporus sulphureus 93-53 TaxID=1314785 RepID=A0A165EE38_9APHY|nr:uncharacterized protein LAESUDRAFT_139767 [Laetiporus sulphureus 93-53]KZT06842.1 hypothetical protein LAESUDRAFT_139767 [Laetiporus sulphureus 93-53]
MDAKSQPRLKIKLKLPASGSVQTALSTSEETGGTSSRREASRDSDIESEEEDEVESEDEEEEEDEEDDDQSTRSASVATSGTASRTLTARQAVLANVVDSSHVSLGERHHPRRRKQLTEMEIALKREETARKRKNLSEKKLEDEKMETINRLLKKQSRGKGRRNALSTAEDKPTPLASTANLADVDAEDGDVAASEPVAPTMYRWISTSRASGADAKSSSDKKMLLSFSIPAVLLPSEEARTAKMDVDEEPRAAQMPECDVQGCTERRKYRLVKDWSRGACGMSHLKLLEAQLS